MSIELELLINPARNLGVVVVVVVVFSTFLLSDIVTKVLKHKPTFTSLSPEKVFFPVYFQPYDYCLC